jgi:hypothetical protein
VLCRVGCHSTYAVDCRPSCSALKLENLDLVKELDVPVEEDNEVPVRIAT